MTRSLAGESDSPFAASRPAARERAERICVPTVSAPRWKFVSANFVSSAVR